MKENDLLDSIFEIEEKKSNTVSVDFALKSYNKDWYLKYREKRSTMKTGSTRNSALYKYMIKTGIIIVEDGKRYFADSSIGKSCGNNVRIYENKIADFCKLLGL
jgi:hypothetical protein